MLEPSREDEMANDAAGAAHEVATLAGGCFWCLDAVFRQLRGVERVESGYSGGQYPNPTYRDVCSGMTGHAEVLQITFDPRVISFHDLLGVFFTIHDPTTLNRQGGDVGTQYRSAIFYHSAEQRDAAEQVIDELNRNKVWHDPIVTQLEAFTTFYSAETYHQDYFAANGDQPYCQVVVAPKVAKFRKQYLDRLRSDV
jgi:peptide-methionine (S)-S-oxide reductase